MKLPAFSLTPMGANASPPLLTSLDEAKTNTKSTPALTADVFQLTTPVAPQNRAGNQQPINVENYLSKLLVDIESQNKKLRGNVFRQVRSLCFDLGRKDAKQEDKFPSLFVAGQQRTFHEIGEVMSHPKKLEKPLDYAQEVLTQLKENPLLLKNRVFIDVCQEVKSSQEIEDKVFENDYSTID